VVMKTVSVSLVLMALLGCASTAPSASTPSTPASAAGPSVVVTPEMGSPHPGDAAPDFTLTDQNGQRVTLSALRGSVVVLAFVASYCPFSEAAQPNLKKLSDEFAPRGVKVVAVDVREDDTGYRKYVTRTHMPFPVLHDAEGVVSTAYAPALAQPGVKDRSKVVVTSNLVIDRDGRIRFFTLLDTTHFDAELVHVRRAVDGAIGG
jgi:peroxiredoxin